MDGTTPGAHRPTKFLSRLATLLWLLTLPSPGAHGAEAGWPEALAAMPLPSPASRVGRDNAICLILDAFRSNAVVKAIVVLPGVSADFYLVNRDQPALNLPATNLWQAVQGLTNATAVRATLQPPFLLLHLPHDRIDPDPIIEDQQLARRLKDSRPPGALKYCDAHWEKLQPALQQRIGKILQPAARSREAWHFERHNFSGWALSDWELLLATSLSGGTRLTVKTDSLRFQGSSAR